MPFIDRTDSKNYQPSETPKRLFIGRADEIEFFKSNILMPDKPLYNIVSISGQGGIGKSTLLSYLIDLATSASFKDICSVAFVDNRQTTSVSIMERFAEQLKLEGDFKKELTNYKESLRKLESEREATRENFWRKTSTDVASSLVKDVPVVGGLLEKGARPAIGYFFDEMHSRPFVKRC